VAIEHSHPPSLNIRKKENRKQRTENGKHITTIKTENIYQAILHSDTRANPTAHSHELPPPKPNAFHQNFISKNEIQTLRAITRKNIDFQKRNSGLGSSPMLEPRPLNPSHPFKQKTKTKILRHNLTCCEIFTSIFMDHPDLPEPKETR